MPVYVCVRGLRGVSPRPRGAVRVQLRCRCCSGGGCPYCGVLVCCAMSLACSRACAPTLLGSAEFPSRFAGFEYAPGNAVPERGSFDWPSLFAVRSLGAPKSWYRLASRVCSDRGPVF